MRCQVCGRELQPGEVVCPQCGTQNVQAIDQMYYQQPVQQTNGMAIAGFVLSFIIPLLGLIFSIIGYSKSKQMNGANRGLALAGIIISSVFMVLGIIYAIIIATSAGSYYY